MAAAVAADGNGNVIGNVMVIDPVDVAALVNGNVPVEVIDLAWTSTIKDRSAIVSVATMRTDTIGDGAWSTYRPLPSAG